MRLGVSSIFGVEVVVGWCDGWCYVLCGRSGGEKEISEKAKIKQYHAVLMELFRSLERKGACKCKEAGGWITFTTNEASGILQADKRGGTFFRFVR